MLSIVIFYSDCLERPTEENEDIEDLFKKFEVKLKNNCALEKNDKTIYKIQDRKLYTQQHELDSPHNKT